MGYFGMTKQKGITINEGGKNKGTNGNGTKNKGTKAATLKGKGKKVITEEEDKKECPWQVYVVKHRKINGW